jgi:hypothetical protein
MTPEQIKRIAEYFYAGVVVVSAAALFAYVALSKANELKPLWNSLFGS